MKAKSEFILLVMLRTIVFCEYTPEKPIIPHEICDFQCSNFGVQCLKDCNEKLPKIRYGDQEAMANATLICRDATFIILAHDFGTFFIEHRTSQNGNWSVARVGIDERSAYIHKLAPETRYQFRFHRALTYEISQPEITGWFETMSDTHKPLKVTNISVVLQELVFVDDYEPLALKYIIEFTPAEDRSCYYNRILDDEPGNHVVNHQVADEGYSFSVTNMHFEMTYTISIWANKVDGVSGDTNVMNFTTPSCLNMRTDMTIGTCPLDKVEGLNATTTRNGENGFDVNVTWAMPKFIPDGYYMWMYPNIVDKKYFIEGVASGNVTNFVFLDVKSVKEFQVRIQAYAYHRGIGTLAFKNFERPASIIAEVAEPGNFIPKYLISTISVVIGIGIGIAVYVYFRLRKQRLRQVDEYEVSPKRLMTTRVLGTGAFGIVRLSRLQDDQGNFTNVAVKMLRDDSNENDLRSLLHEIKMMKALDEHPNVVSLLGCCTIGPDPFLVVEYCSRGDLRSFLRKSLVEARSLVVGAEECTSISQKSPQRKKILKKNCDMSSMSRIDDDYVQIFCSAEDQDTTCDSVRITAGDMLNFGRQIATGMEFLSLNRIVHRDLAARNVLVCYDRTVKISDFGMSRDIYRENVYKKSGNGRMPLRWMAIESLTHQLYSLYSDVWSFGILLWEIVTLGGDPYPGVPTIDLLKRLQAGYRMERPENCSISLHDVMLSCWRTRPQDRPTFTILRQELDKLICLTTENEYLDLNEVSEGRLILSQSRDSGESRVKYIQEREVLDGRVSLPQGPNCGGVGDHI